MSNAGDDQHRRQTEISAAHEEHHDQDDPRASHLAPVGGWNRRTVLGAAGSAFVLAASGLVLPAATASTLDTPPVLLGQHHQAPHGGRRPRRDRRRDGPRGGPDRGRGSGSARGMISFFVVHLGRGNRRFETEFWVALPRSTSYGLRREEIVDFGDITDFSTISPGAILRLNLVNEDCVVSVRDPNDGAPELILGLGGKVTERGWRGGRTVFEGALSVGERAPVMRARDFSVMVERQEASRPDASFWVTIS